MSSDIAIKATNLSKAFKLYKRPVDMFLELFTSRPLHELFWALQDVSFELQKGEMIAFIGRNGAGKSTLLKIIAGTLDKSSGRFEVMGRVASILELGTGFNPEYTGIDNVRLGGLCLGLSKQEVEDRLDWIIDFSELRHVIDRPFKTYSSGMQARLTFATAICIDPEVLIVDEALSVGDLKFQVKCFDKLHEFRKKGGTILLVTHDLNTVNMFCDKAYWIDGGRIVDEGKPKDITNDYYKSLFQNDKIETLENAKKQKEKHIQALRDYDEEIGSKIELDFATPPLHSIVIEKINKPVSCGDGSARIIDYGIYNRRGDRVSVTNPDEIYYLHMRVATQKPLSKYRISYAIRDNYGTFIFGTGSHTMHTPVPKLSAGEIRDYYFEMKIPRINHPYLVTLGIAADEETIYDLLQDCIAISADANELAFVDSCIQIKTKIRMGRYWRIESLNVDQN